MSFARLRTLRWLSCVCLLWVVGCGDSESDATRPPGTGFGSGSPGPSGGGLPDAATPPDTGDGDGDASDEDAGALDPSSQGVLPIECDTIDPANFVGEDTPVGGGFFTGVTMPVDFSVTRIESAWGPSCATPTFLVTLSEGRCPNGSGQELVFFFDAEAVDSGGIHVGQNEVLPDAETAGLRIRYRRPDEDEPSGEWGTCDGATGIVDLVGDVDLMMGTHLQGRFQLQLTPCDGVAEGVQSVLGTFDALVRRTQDDVCPSDAP